MFKRIFRRKRDRRDTSEPSEPEGAEDYSLAAPAFASQRRQVQQHDEALRSAQVPLRDAPTPQRAQSRSSRRNDKLFSFRRKMQAAVAQIEDRPTGAGPSSYIGYGNSPPWLQNQAQTPTLPVSPASSASQTLLTPFPPAVSPHGSHAPPPPPPPPPPVPEDAWIDAVKACSLSLVTAQTCLTAHRAHPQLKPLLRKTVALLNEQSQCLVDIGPFAEDKHISSLLTLAAVYDECAAALAALPPRASLQAHARAIEGMRSLVEVLREGPDYLLDVALVECIIWQMQVIDHSLGQALQSSLDRIVGEQAELDVFRTLILVEDIPGVALSAPPHLVTDDIEQDAMSSIEVLVQQLTKRIAPVRVRPGPTPHQAASASTPADSAPPPQHPSPSLTPLASPALSSGPGTASPLPGLQSYNSDQLTARFGAGPSSSGPSHLRSSPAPLGSTPSPPSPASTSSSQKSIFSYRGHRLTRSALELVMRQDALARADSSGQYAGDVSWDDLRNCWIPKWADKLRPGDVAEGEVPDTDPANYTQRERDAWGNQVGWSEGRMYYHKEPTFDL